MIQVAEIIYIVPEEREAYLEKMLNPTEEELKVAWAYGIRNKGIYRLNEYIFEIFDYDGKQFYKDMREYSVHPLVAPYLISKRRKELSADELKTTNWWAPLKIAGRQLMESPIPDENDQWSMAEWYRGMVSGYMVASTTDKDVSYDDDDWSESLHF